MRLAATPEDFIVDEIPLFEASGEGGHTYLQIEKRGLDSTRVARELARAAGVAPREIGFAGRKDRHAVTRQWFSAPNLDVEVARALAGDGWRALDARAHGHKLRTGQLRGNRFELRLREIERAEREGFEERLAKLEASGLPNRFGPQRFGREGDNAARGREILMGGSLGRDRKSARFLVSAYQAELFNRVLARRELPFDRLEVGELAFKHDSGAAFLVEDAERESARARAFEISPSGPIVGTRMTQPQGDPGERERSWLREWGVPEPLRAPRGLRLRGARRALRVPADGLGAHWEDDATLHLVFSLPSGSYATVLVETLFP